jgi:hypothetical protein
MKRQAHGGESIAPDSKRQKTIGGPVFPEIVSYDCLKHIKLATPVEIQHPKTHYLKIASEGYRIQNKLVGYTDSSRVTSPLDSWQEIVPAINRAIQTCIDGGKIQTFFKDDTHQKAPTPSGMHMFEVPCEIPDSLIHDAYRDAQNIYWNPRHRANKKIHVNKPCSNAKSYILFYPGLNNGKYKIRDILQILFTETPSLAKYIMIYVSAIKHILNLDQDELDSASMNIVHYDPMGGISPHVDTVYIFDGTLGPIFTVAMGPSEKMLDLLPVLLPDSFQPVRLFSNPNEIMLMDGIARTLWAHSKPLQYPHEQFSLVFKFPELKRKTKITPFEYGGAALSIPHYYVAPSGSRVSAHD